MSIPVSRHTIEPWLEGGMNMVRWFSEHGALVDQALRQGTRYMFGPTEHTAHYDIETDEVVLTPALGHESLFVVGAVVLHETIHALRKTRFGDSRAGVRKAFEEEIAAFSYEAAFWGRVRGRFTHAPYFSPYVFDLERIWLLWQQGALQTHVLLSRTYQEFAFGRPLVV